MEIFEETAEHQLIQPTFITEYPTEVSPLARRNDDNPDVTDRFEFFVGGRELANGFSELNDAEDQAERSERKWLRKMQATMKRCITTTTIFARWNMAYRQRQERALVLIGW